MEPRRSSSLPWPVVLIPVAIFSAFGLLIVLGVKDKVHRSLTQDPGYLTPSTTSSLIVNAATVIFGNGRYPGPPDLIHRVADLLEPPHSGLPSTRIRRPGVTLLLGLRYNSVDLMQYYINHVHYRRSGARTVKGFSAASEAFFGLPVESLSAGEICILLELAFREPGAKLDHPYPILETRQRLLSQLHTHGVLSTPRYIEESQLPLSFVEDHIPVR